MSSAPATTCRLVISVSGPTRTAVPLLEPEDRSSYGQKVPAASTLDRAVRQDVFQVTVYLLRRAANLSLKEVSALAGVSPPRISQIQRAIEDAGGLGSAFRWAGSLAMMYLP